jgi:hypothetical protein
MRDFDSAFHSRIHLTMEYKSLTLEEKKGIWRKAIRGISDEAYAISEAEFERLGQLDLDGRTIQNVVHVLKLYLGKERKKPLSLSDVKIVLGVATGNVQAEVREQINMFCSA